MANPHARVNEDEKKILKLIRSAKLTYTDTHALIIAGLNQKIELYKKYLDSEDNTIVDMANKEIEKCNDMLVKIRGK